MHDFTNAFEVSLFCLVDAICPSNEFSKDWRTLCKSYDGLIQEMTRDKVAAILKVNTEMVIELSKRIRSVKKMIADGKCGVNANIQVLRTISLIEFILKKDISTKLIKIDAFSSGNLAEKQLRAIELSIRLVIASHYKNQDELISRLKILFKSEAVDKWLKCSKDKNVLSGTLLSELANIFTHPLEFNSYNYIYADCDCLSFLSDQRETVKLFLDDVRFIRNYVAHAIPLSYANVLLADIYYDQIISPVQDKYDNGKISVNPESLVEMRFESKVVYELSSVEAVSREILSETKLISDNVNDIKAETNGLRERTNEIKIETKRLGKKARTILVSAVCIICLLGAASWALFHGKKEVSDNPRKELANMGVKWDPEAMWNAMRNKDYAVVELFLKGGMSPYASFNQPLIWHAITNPAMDADVIIPLYAKYKYDLNKPIVFQNTMLALNLPHSMQGERTPLALAIESNKEIAIKCLLEAKVDIDLALKDVKNDLPHVFGAEKNDIKKGLAFFEKMTGRVLDDGNNTNNKGDSTKTSAKENVNKQTSSIRPALSPQVSDEKLATDLDVGSSQNKGDINAVLEKSFLNKNIILDQNSLVSRIMNSILAENVGQIKDLAISSIDIPSIDKIKKSESAKFSAIGNDLFNNKRDVAASLSAYERAYSLNRYSPEVCGSYGYVLLNSGQFEKAHEKLLQSIELKPTYSSAWYTLAQLYGKIGERQRAYACFVGACIFSKKIDVTVKSLVVDSKLEGYEALNLAAADALNVCKKSQSY